ncbi:hypothetical protein B0T25DRAFT_125930 [Lasiosphaeria hispida]|uniref:Uncharacterized protein n=1 Tax=Lasiosphaeria hispida TaxID=260671 RepID=A0AAJ0MIG6_9PEZI|nr:hypothetical protein B0T25DRAFT_125930 [Lasiosphaeria hispida]
MANYSNKPVSSLLQWLEAALSGFRFRYSRWTLDLTTGPATLISAVLFLLRQDLSFMAIFGSIALARGIFCIGTGHGTYCTTPFSPLQHLITTQPVADAFFYSFFFILFFFLPDCLYYGDIIRVSGQHLAYRARYQAFLGNRELTRQLGLFSSKRFLRFYIGQPSGRPLFRFVVWLHYFNLVLAFLPSLHVSLSSFIIVIRVSHTFFQSLVTMKCCCMYATRQHFHVGLDMAALSAVIHVHGLRP